MYSIFLRSLIATVLLLPAAAWSVSTDTRTTQVSIMTYNIHHGADAKELNQIDNMGRFIREQNPDFVGLQEVDQGCKRSGNVDQMARLAEITGMHPAFAAHFPYQGGEYGVGILSRYPLSNIQNNRITVLKDTNESNTRALLTATATLPDGSRLTLATAHFALDHPSRLLQTNETLAVLSKALTPTIFTGDLNTTPSAPEIAQLKTELVDCDGMDLLTFPVPRATKKIDYIFLNRGCGPVTKSVSVPDCRLSDHFPVVCKIEVDLATGVTGRDEH